MPLARHAGTPAPLGGFGGALSAPPIIQGLRSVEPEVTGDGTATKEVRGKRWRVA